MTYIFVPKSRIKLVSTSAKNAAKHTKVISIAAEMSIKNIRKEYRLEKKFKNAYTKMIKCKLTKNK